MDECATWDAAAVARCLASRIAAARADQVTAERYGRERRDDCDRAAAEEMVCAALLREETAADRAAFVQSLQHLLARDEHVWRGVYDDVRFDRHVRSHVRALMKMARTNTGFAKLTRYR